MTHSTNGQSVIEVRGVRKVYGRKVALDSVDLSIRRGEAFAVIGQNGAGKTTLLEILMGLRRPDEGHVTVLGVDLLKDPKVVQGQIGVQLQDSQLLRRASVREYMELFAALYGSTTDIEDIAGRLSLKRYLDLRIGKLSGGQLQRVTLALALVGQPQIIFLDEPTTGLDPIARRELWDVIRTLKADGRTVLLVTHYMEEVEQLCDRLAVIVEGRVVAVGTAAEVADTAKAPGAKLDDIYEALVSRRANRIGVQ